MYALGLLHIITPCFLCLNCVALRYFSRFEEVTFKMSTYNIWGLLGSLKISRMYKLFCINLSSFHHYCIVRLIKLLSSCNWFCCLISSLLWSFFIIVSLVQIKNDENFDLKNMFITARKFFEPCLFLSLSQTWINWQPEKGQSNLFLYQEPVSGSTNSLETM